MSQFLLPGPRVVARNKAPMGVLLMLLVLFGAALGAYVLSERSAKSIAAPAPVPPAQTDAHLIDAKDEDLEDIANHLQHARDGVRENIDKIKRAQARIEQVLPLLEERDLSMHKARLQLAQSGCTAAMSAADRALEELDMATATIRRRRNKQ
jgi:hypothetical protein